MLRPDIRNEKAYLLFMVLSTMIIVMLFASVLLSLVLSQSRLTKHDTSRIQAYYANLAGYNYAFDNLRRNAAGWPATGPLYSHYICRIPAGCPAPNSIDAELPKSIQSIKIDVYPPGTGPVNTRRIEVTTDYSLNP